MKLKALAAVVAATPLMVACGSAEKTSFKLNGAGATFPAPLYNSWLQNMAQETGNQVITGIKNHKMNLSLGMNMLIKRVDQLIKKLQVMLMQ